MPTICRFAEISIKMNKEGGVQHKRPHIHAYYKETSASFDIETGEVLASEDFPNEQRKAVVDWIGQERAELLREWDTLIAGGEWFTINKPNS